MSVLLRSQRHASEPRHDRAAVLTERARRGRVSDKQHPSA